VSVVAGLVQERRGEVLLLRLDRPKRRNAINMALLGELRHAIDAARIDDAVRALVVTGSVEAFSAGQDTKEAEPPGFAAAINAVFAALEALPKPTLAAICGWCIAGGLELALCCDMRIAAEDARIGDWHARINSIGGAGATVRLVRLLGLARAKELVFSGIVLSGAAARELGLVSYAYPADSVVERAIEHARALCVADALTVGYAKRALNAAADLTLEEALAYALRCQGAVREAHAGAYAGRFGGQAAAPTTTED